ncbi:hypothetical protein [uncultured Roseibium sp.]|uniref:hypothetical protein n=1 Tax=uncultured Roseibium sp. TaxID=1936171 RepID=UPI003216625F
MTNPITNDMGRFSTSVLTVKNRHSGLRIDSFDPIRDVDSLEEAVKGLRVFERVLNTEPGQKYLWEFRPSDMIERDVMMVTVRHDDLTIGTMQFNRDEENALWFRAAAVLPEYGGMQLATAMGSVGLCHDAMMHLVPPKEIDAAIRQMPDGSLNEASKRSFVKLGFLLEVEPGQTYLSGRWPDRHLFSSAEFNEEGEAFIRYRRMIGEPDVALQEAKAFLTGWTEKVLPFPKRALLT